MTGPLKCCVCGEPATVARPLDPFGKSDATASFCSAHQDAYWPRYMATDAKPINVPHGPGWPAQWHYIKGCGCDRCWRHEEELEAKGRQQVQAAIDKAPETREDLYASLVASAAASPSRPVLGIGEADSPQAKPQKQETLLAQYVVGPYDSKWFEDGLGMMRVSASNRDSYPITIRVYARLPDPTDKPKVQSLLQDPEAAPECGACGKRHFRWEYCTAFNIMPVGEDNLDKAWDRAITHLSTKRPDPGTPIALQADTLQGTTRFRWHTDYSGGFERVLQQMFVNERTGEVTWREVPDESIVSTDTTDNEG